jgi:teichuronic acid exporter
MMNNDRLPSEDGALFQRFKTSVVSYGLRQFAVVALTFGYNIALTHYLLPAEFGKVAVVLIVVNIAVLLADGGFGVYLIQRHAEIDQHDLSRVTTIQFSIASLLCILCFVASAVAKFFYPEQQIGWMVSFASLSLPLLVIRGMALLLLERSVRIDKVVRVEIFEESVYAIIAISLAVYGFGAWSVVIAQISKAIVGCITAVSIGTFRFKLVPVVWDNDLRKGFRFGFHYQAAQLINMARVSIIPLYIVPMFGYQSAGFVERSLFFCSAPLSIILAIQKKTVFPYIARIQRDLAKIRRFTENSIYISAVLDKAMFLPLLIFAREVILIIFGAEWLPMLQIMYWVLAGNIIFGALAGTLYPVANGLGKSEFVSGLNLASFVISWLLMVPLTLLFNISGVGIAAFVMWFGIHWMKVLITRYIGNFKYYGQVTKPVLAFGIAAITSKLLIKALAADITTLFSLVKWSLFVSFLYVMIIMLMDWRRIRIIFKTTFQSE